jgi:hypothetical protein
MLIVAAHRWQPSGFRQGGIAGTMVAAATTTATRGFFAALFGFSRGLSKSTAALAALFASGGVAARFSREHDPQDDDRRDQEDCA